MHEGFVHTLFIEHLWYAAPFPCDQLVITLYSLLAPFLYPFGFSCCTFFSPFSQIFSPFLSVFIEWCVCCQGCFVSCFLGGPVLSLLFSMLGVHDISSTVVKIPTHNQLFIFTDSFEDVNCMFNNQLSFALASMAYDWADKLRILDECWHNTLA